MPSGGLHCRDGPAMAENRHSDTIGRPSPTPGGARNATVA